MVYDNVIEGHFLERPNRFIAHCRIKDQVVVAHVKNTGRCKELLVPEAKVYLNHAAHGNRKTAYDLIAVEKGSMLVNMDSQAPNEVVHEALIQGRLKLPESPSILETIKREHRYDASRFDLYLEGQKSRPWKGLLEVKGVTLEEEGLALFPDAPTLRGLRHLEELIQASLQGYACYVVFVVQMKPVSGFAPHHLRHPAFAEALSRAQAAGVHVLAYDCIVSPNQLILDQRVKVLL